MKNIIARIGVSMMASMLLFGCAGQSKDKSVKTVNEGVATIQKQQNDSSMLSTIELDGMKVTWIRDNANDKVMPLSLFPDATKAQVDSLSLQDDVPASISTFLVEKDGKQILFDTGMGLPTVNFLKV